MFLLHQWLSKLKNGDTVLCEFLNYDIGPCTKILNKWMKEYQYFVFVLSF